MKVLITGGAGFIGSHVVEECLAHNYEVQPRKYPIRQGEIEKSVLDNEKATNVLGWQATQPLKEGLKETIFSYNPNK